MLSSNTSTTQMCTVYWINTLDNVKIKHSHFCFKISKYTDNLQCPLLLSYNYFRKNVKLHLINICFRQAFFFANQKTILIACKTVNCKLVSAQFIAPKAARVTKETRETKTRGREWVRVSHPLCVLRVTYLLMRCPHLLFDTPVTSRPPTPRANAL